MKKIFLILLCSLGWAQIPTQTMGTVNTVGSVTLGGAAGVALQSITVLPSNFTSPLGVAINYSALATFSDGSTSDVTAQATWTLSPPGIATNTANVVTCVAAGATGVRAAVAGIQGSTNLTCQAVQIAPSGVLSAAFQNVAYTQQFTGIGGTPPYTFASSDLPAWATLGTSTGLLSGTPVTLGTYNFHVTLADAVADTTGPVLMTVDVVVQPSEDNRYCNTNETTNFSPSTDGGATLPTNCVYTGIANTPATSGNVLYVCPPTERNRLTGTLVNGCANAQTPGFMNYYNSVQSAMNAAHCGDWVQLLAVSYAPGGGSFSQNIFNEDLTIPATTCAWGTPPGGIWVTTAKTSGQPYDIGGNGYENLPAPGTRISPAWGGQTSIVGMPDYNQPTAAGIYMPAIRCFFTGPLCQDLATPAGSTGASAWRFIGIEFTAPHGREVDGGSPVGYPTTTQLCPNNFNGTRQCSPGYNNPLVSIGCTNYPQATCGVTGAQHIILDRVWLHSCDDKTEITCLDSAREGLEMQGGKYLAIVDSYINGFKCMSGIGPCVEAHGISGGNEKNTGDGGPSKIVNNFVSASSVDIF